MKTLIEIVDEIIRYGLGIGRGEVDKERALEESLIQLYAIYFRIEFEFDEKEYPDFDKKFFPHVIDHVKENFPNFGMYYTVLNLSDVGEEAEIGIGDAIDDLSDIIYDLLELKWKYEHNSEADAAWFFSMIFPSHTQQHLLDLLNFMKSNKS
ncbi:MAG: DUF5063 domain-containing protein [Bacteroidota bacterium]